MSSYLKDTWSYLWTDPLREGIRLALAVLTFIIPLFIAKDGIDNLAHADAVRNGLQWAAVTCVMVTQPLLGKVSQMSFERTCGTVIGGSLAMAMLFSGQVGAVLACLGVVAVVATFIGGTNKMDYGGKLCVVTYVIVCGCVCSGADAIVSQWASRVLGIISGIFLTLVLSIVVFPRSATNKAMQEIRKAITALGDMHEASWNIVLVPHKDPAEDLSEQRKKDSEACEKAYASAIVALRGIEDSIPISKDEAILGSFLGGRVLFPRWHLISREDSGSTLPGDKVQALATALRRSYRSLWSLHLALDDGFGLDLTIAFIESRYSASGLLEELRSSMKDFIDQLLVAFPSEYGGVNTCIKGKEAVDLEGLNRYEKSLRDLLDLSDSLYRKLVDRPAETIAVRVASKVEAITAELSITISEAGQSPHPAVSNVSRSWQLPVACPSMPTGRGEEIVKGEALESRDRGDQAEGPPIQARLRWYSARFAMQCLLREALELHSAANDLLANIPGRETVN